MTLYRRSFLTGLAGFAALGMARSALAETPRDYEPLLRKVLDVPWDGVGTMPSNAVEGGKFIVSLTYRFDLKDDFTIGGTHDFDTFIDNRHYRATYALEGSVWVEGDRVGLNISDTSQIRGDRLPGYLYWQGWQGALQFYNNSEQADHYILGGKLIGQTGNEFFDVKLGN